MARRAPVRRSGWITGKRLVGKAVTPRLQHRPQPPRASSLGARGALLLPLFVGPVQQVLGAGTAQMRAAIHDHHLAIDVAGLVGNQEARKVGEFGMLAGAAERIALRPGL